jgi:hypothetical protein
MVKYLTIFMFIITVAHINFVIRIPAVAPLYMKMDKTTTFSGGELTLSNGVYILSNP